MTETAKNVCDAYTGESKARNKYTFISEMALQQKKPRLAALFKAAAQAEEIHARALFKNMAAGKNLEALVQEAIDGETYEYTEMYPTFKAKADEEGKTAEATLFARTAPVEESHKVAYSQALDALKKGIDLGDSGLKVYLCPICGYIHIGTSPVQCPVCKLPADKFVEVQ